MSINYKCGFSPNIYSSAPNWKICGICVIFNSYFDITRGYHPDGPRVAGAGHPAAPGLMEAAKGLIVGATQRSGWGSTGSTNPKFGLDRAIFCSEAFFVGFQATSRF